MQGTRNAGHKAVGHAHAENDGVAAQALDFKISGHIITVNNQLFLPQSSQLCLCEPTRTSYGA
jgi:hypothetical protein